MELLNNGWDDLETGEFPAPGVSKRKSQWLPVESAMKGSSVVRWLSSHLPPVPRGSESPAPATEAGAPRARVPEQGQACAPQLERSPWPTAARESPRAAVKTQSSQQ